MMRLNRLFDKMTPAQQEGRSQTEAQGLFKNAEGTEDVTAAPLHVFIMLT